LNKSLVNRNALITGATGGIGFQTAISLAEAGARVIISGRNRADGKQACQNIKAVTGNQDIHLVLGDLSTRDGVHAVASLTRELTPQIDILINNAGVAAPNRILTNDGIETNAATNIMAPYLLTTELWRHLSQDARVICLNGGSGLKQLDLDNLQSQRQFAGLTSYSHSKLAMMVTMYELAITTKDSGKSINVCYPGQARTRMTQSVSREMLPGALRFAFPIFKLLTRPDNGESAIKASRSSVFLATSHLVEGRTGIYVNKSCKEVPWPEIVHDLNTRKVVISEVREWAGLSPA
jgi:NAD(P)-dependent dehydrogenase (short-subunit alcohol dehydrogenase family)